MKKKKKSKHQESEEASLAENAESPRRGGSKTRLRRRREGSFLASESDSSEEKKPKKRKRKKRSRATSITTEDSSEIDIKGSKFTEEESKSKHKEITEHDLVQSMRGMVPYLDVESPLWTKWTLAPFYHFIRKPSITLAIAFIIEPKASEDLPEIIKRLARFFESQTTDLILITFNQIIPDYPGGFFYFVKSVEEKITSENFEELITFGNVPGKGSLKNILTYLWTPILLQDECIPQGIKSEVFTDLNTLTYTSQSISQLTDDSSLVLPVPQDLLLTTRTIIDLSKDRDFCVRLEESVLFWQLKLKETLINQDNSDESELGPLDELCYWITRKANLTLIISQIKSEPIKKLISILALSRSPYLDQLISILIQVSKAHTQACSNAHFLQTLVQPCSPFPNCKLSQVQTNIQKFIWVVLIIQRNAPFYSEPQRINSLMRKFSNLLIHLCNKRVKISHAFQGKAQKAIQNCLKCLNWWKEIYKSTQAMSEDEWIFDYDQVFTHVDAMITRLNDLLFISTIQTLYSGVSIIYPGLQGPHISTVMESISKTVAEKIKELSTVQHLILNVKETEWISHIKQFRAEIYSIEIKLQNLLRSVFGQIGNLKGKLELLKLFFRFYKRDIITREIEKLSINLYEYFEDQVMKLRRLFELKVVPLPKTYSQMAGRGAWAIFMRKKIESHLETLNKEVWLPESAFGSGVKSEAKSLIDALAQFTQNTYEEWANSKELEEGGDFKAKLDIPLLIRQGREKKDIVEVNFDRNIFKILAEAEIWAKVGRPVPLALLLSIYPAREKLHLIMENITMVAKAYNGVVCGLSRDEKLLFRERLGPLEKKIFPCLTRFTWASYIVTDQIFVEEFQVMAAEVFEHVRMYREANLKVTQVIWRMSKRFMIAIEPHKIYEVDEFHKIQTEKIEKELKIVVKDYENVAGILRELFRVFSLDGPEVKVEWGKYVKLVDDCVEEALNTSLQRSLGVLERSICLGGRPLFVVELKLEGRKVEFSPKLEKLAGMIFGVKRNIAMALEPLSRISRYLGSKVKNERSFTNALLNEKVTKEMEAKMKFSVEKFFSELNLYSERWMPYRDIWEVEAKRFMEGYGARYPSLKAYEKDMARYLEVAAVVHGSEDFINIGFVRVNCTSLKEGISKSSMEWFGVIGGELYDKFKRTVEGLYGYMEGNRKRFSEEPKSLEEQVESFRQLELVKNETAQKKSLFPVIKEEFEILKKFKFEVESEVEVLYLEVEGEWKKYKKFLREASRELEKCYDKLREAFLECSENLKEKVGNLLKHFDKEGPFSRGSFMEGEGEYWEDALTSLENYLNDVLQLKEDDKKIISSLEFFNIEKRRDENLVNLELEVISLTMVWGIVRQWELYWGKEKGTKAGSVDIKEVDKCVSDFLQKFKKLERKFERKAWPVIGETLEFIEGVKASLRTVNILKENSLRDRHWDRVKVLLGPIDSQRLPEDSENSALFSLELVVTLKLYLYLEQLSEISLSSGKETVVEDILKEIEYFWGGESFILERRKGLIPFEVKVGPNLNSYLMDHTVSLSAMKGSPFIWPFQEKVEYWTGLLSEVGEVLETFLETQNEWIKLEKVFSSEDVRKEVPWLSKKFRTISCHWATLILAVTEERNVAKVVTSFGKQVLEDLKAGMELLRKNLQDFLQEKRNEFPRLYFIMDHELMELLGESVEKAQSILRQLFNFGQVKLKENIGLLEEINCSGESLRLSPPISVKSPLTQWLKELENSMKEAVKVNLEQCLESLQQNKRDWISDSNWTCQSLLTAHHTNWTLDVTKAIYFSTTPGKGEPFTLKKIGKSLKKNISKLSETLKIVNSLIEKVKVEEMLLKLIHLRELTEEVERKGVNDLDSFEWLKNIRFYMEGECPGGNIVIKQGKARLQYGYEFYGGGSKFVITPVVDRCFLDVTSAMSSNQGAFLEGCTGKNESLRQLGKLSGRYCLDVHLSQDTELSYLTSVIKGSVQTGSWAIINITNCLPHIIAQIAYKFKLITRIKGERLDNLMLDGVELKMDRNCALFVISNTNSNLSSLKCVMRRATMPLPDTTNILDVHLFIAGFENSIGLARKISEVFLRGKESIGENTFSLDGMYALVKKAVEYKQVFKKKLSDAEAIVKALQNTILPSLKQEEAETFDNLIRAKFPLDIPLKTEYPIVEEAIRKGMNDLSYQPSEKIVKDCLRLFDLIEIYETVIILGETGSGKTVTRKVLKNAMQRLHESEINEHVIHPETFDPSELFGYFDFPKGRWRDGIFSKLKEIDKKEAGEKSWIILDGPLGSNFLGGRIDEMISFKVGSNGDGSKKTILIETDDLTSSSPSLLSKAGVIFIPERNGWKLKLRSWFHQINLDSDISKYISEMVRKCLDFYSDCKAYLKQGRNQAIFMFTELFNSFSTELDNVKLNVEEEKYDLILKQVIFFSITWSLFGTLDKESEQKASAFLKDLDSSVFPTKGTIYDFFIDFKTQKWIRWGSLVQFAPKRKMISTDSTVRCQYFLKRLSTPTLLVGYANSGKTGVISSTLESLNSSEIHSFHVQLTPLMEAKSLQSLIRGRLQQISSYVLAPQGKRLISFIDNLHAFSLSNQNKLSYCEFIRGIIEYTMWYDRVTYSAQAISNLSIISAMTLSKLNPIPARLQSKFYPIYLPSPDEYQLRRIFTSILKEKLDDFVPPVKLLGDDVTVATLDFFKLISSKISSAPFHIFSIHDISKVYEGILRAERSVQDTKQSFLKLWFHECNRVFMDKLIDSESREICQNTFDELIMKHFESVESLAPELIFGNFMSRKRFYEEIKNEVELRKVLDKSYKKLGNDENGFVLFKEGLIQVGKITRVLSTRKGHLINYGKAGQGRQLLTRLSAKVLGFEIFEMINSKSMKELMKEAYQKCLDDVGCCVILADEHVMEDTFELISLVTSSVEIPGMFEKKELQELGKAGGEKRNALDYVKEKVEKNLHVVLCLRPDNDLFRKCVIQYPSILKEMSLTSFEIWEKASFLEVAKSLMEEEKGDQLNPEIFYACHSIAERFGSESITPAHFLSLVSIFISLVKQARFSCDERIKLLQTAIKEINCIKEKIGSLTEQAGVADKKADCSRLECKNLLEIVKKQEADTISQENLVVKESGRVETEVKEFDELSEVIRKEWSDALQVFEESACLLQDVSDEDLTHIKSYYSPPPLVQRVLDAVMIMLDRDQTWPEAKIQISHPDFTRKIIDYDKGSVTLEKLENLKKFVQNPEFTPDAVAKYSNGARILCTWIHAVDKYCRIYLTQISPKRQKLEGAEGSITEKKFQLELSTQKLQLLKENLAELQSNYEAKYNLKETYENEAGHWNELLSRAESVLGLLKEDQANWEEEMSRLEKKMRNVLGDCLLASACVAYLGPSRGELRDLIKKEWIEEMKLYDGPDRIRVSDNFNLQEFLEGTDMSEEAKIENILIKKSERKLLIMDPHDILEPIQDTKAINAGGARTASELLNIYRNEEKAELKLLLITKESNFGLEVTSKIYIIDFTLPPKGIEEQIGRKIAEFIFPEISQEAKRLEKAIREENLNISGIKQELPKLVIKFGEGMLDNGDFSDALISVKEKLKESEKGLDQAMNQLLELQLKRKRFLPEKLGCIYKALGDLSEFFPEYDMSLNLFIELILKIITSKPKKLEDDDSNDDELLPFLNGTCSKTLIRLISQSVLECIRHLLAVLLCLNLPGVNSDKEELHFLRNTLVNSDECVGTDTQTQIENLATKILGDELTNTILQHNQIDFQEIYFLSETFNGNIIPIIFLLNSSPEVDPMDTLQAFCNGTKPPTKLYSLVMSSENAELSKKLIEEGISRGFSVYLSNSHFAPEFMQELEEMLRSLDTDVHPNFRLWMSIKIKEFSSGLYRNSIKIGIN